MEITREEYASIIEDIKKQRGIEHDFYNATAKVSLMGEGFYFNTSLLTENLINLLDKSLPCPEAQWTEWWIYENDFGERKLEVGLKDGEMFSLKDVGDLWDFVHDNYENLTRVDKKN